MSVFKDCFDEYREVGEIWYDRAGNECFFRENGRVSCKTVNDGELLTIQSEKDTCDVNWIVAKYGLNSKPIKAIASELLMTPYVNRKTPVYGDFTDAVDYHSAVLRAQQAEEAFLELPAQIRSRFSNDPGKLIDFLGDENNRAEAIQLGLVAPPQDSQLPQGEATPPAAEGG